MKYIIVLLLCVFAVNNNPAQIINCSRDSLIYRHPKGFLDSLTVYNTSNVDLRIDSIYMKHCFPYQITTRLHGISKDWGFLYQRSRIYCQIIIPPNDSLKMLLKINIPVVKAAMLSAFTIDSLYIYNNSRNKPLLSLNIHNYYSAGIEEKENTPNGFILQQNYPNPFNPSTTIKFSIPAVETGHTPSLQHISLKIYDLLGREVATLVNESKPAGNYAIQFNASGLPAGIYLYGIISNNYSYYKKMILLK